MRAAVVLFSAASLWGSAPLAARAQQDASREVASANPEANDFGSEGDESPELRALRLAELEIFARGNPLSDLDDAPRIRIGVPSPAVTSDLGPERDEVAEGEAEDLSWLRNLELPDIPVRWDDRVVRYLEFYRDDPRGRSIMGAWLRRASKWGPMVRQKLRELGLPGDLVYVAMIESGFDPAARSYAGAVGMWQFVRPTGEEYGLGVSHWIDERMDPEEATEAGGRYLRDLFRRFGSWELALASYNMGYGALLRAIRKFNTNDYWVLSRLEAGLPFETTFYVAKVMACAIVGRNPERFGFGDLELETPVRYARVEVPGGTPLGRVARAAGVEPSALEELNPSLRRGRVPPGSARQVRIPADRQEAFARNWTRMQPRHPAHRPYVVRFGESLSDVARRFRTSSSALRTLNELEGGEEVAVGLELLVPAVEPAEPEPPAEPPVVAVPAERFAYADRRRTFYRVTSADRIEEIARFFSVTVDEIRRWNHVEPTAALQHGMVLQLFVPREVDLGRAVVLSEGEVRVLVVGTDEFFDYHEAQQGRVRFRYTVQAGDTLTSIGRRFELSVGSIARINRFSRDTTLRAGQEIIVYAPRERVPRHLLGPAEATAEAEAATEAETGTAAATEAEAGAETGTEGEAEAEGEGETGAGDGSTAAAERRAPSAR